MKGPKVLMNLSCVDCEFYTEKKYRQKDCCVKHFTVCSHPEMSERILWPDERTPSWCPFYPENPVNGIERLQTEIDNLRFDLSEIKLKLNS